MSYTPSRRDTLLIPSGPSGDHLFVITTDACPERYHLVASFTTVYPDRKIDPTCIVQAGEHPFITHESYVLYRSARLESVQKLGTMVDGWVWKIGQPATDELTERIFQGFEASPFTPRFIKNYLKTI